MTTLPRRFVGGAAIAALLVLVTALPSLVAPLAESCPGDVLTPEACHETVVAALERGLAPFHPLILTASVTPGPAGPAGLGERAVISFSMLGVPGRTTVRLFYDMGAHWGGSADRGAVEMALWALLDPLVLLLVLFLARRWWRRQRGAGGRIRVIA